MPTVETSVWIDAPLNKVYAIAKDNRAFPEFMDDVESLVVTSEDGPIIISDWVGRVPAFGLKVRWTQKDIWDDANHACEFSQEKGDYDSMSGNWKFTEENSGTRFDSVLHYEYSVPGLGPLVGKVIYGLVVKNMEGVLAAIKARAEAN
ncbi:SRPBCC family protein [Kamptonema cortianum]|nr:SRPBCC family protein [Geitlerinema splendidum]MDK3155348.1 SRPBCC family protein [Kamptonema cortianum]